LQCMVAIREERSGLYYSVSLTVETEGNGDLWSTNEWGASLVGSLGSSCQDKRDFYPALASLVSSVQHIFSLTSNYVSPSLDTWAGSRAGPPFSESACVSGAEELGNSARSYDKLKKGGRLYYLCSIFSILQAGSGAAERGIQALRKQACTRHHGYSQVSEVIYPDTFSPFFLLHFSLFSFSVLSPNQL
jgi:hypothetical protein